MNTAIKFTLCELIRKARVSKNHLIANLIWWKYIVLTKLRRVFWTVDSWLCRIFDNENSN